MEEFPIQPSQLRAGGFGYWVGGFFLPDFAQLLAAGKNVSLGFVEAFVHTRALDGVAGNTRERDMRLIGIVTSIAEVIARQRNATSALCA